MIEALRAIWQADAGFPSGGFAFSNGIEGLVAGGTVDAEALHAAIEAALRHRWAAADRLAMTRAFHAAHDLDAVAAVDSEIEATTLAEPFRVGSRKNGAGLLAAHVRIATPGAAEWAARVRAGGALGHLAATQGVVWRGAGLDLAGATLASGYVAMSGMATAAVRLGAIGAVVAQRVVARLLPIVAELAASPLGIRIESFAPRLDIVAIRHARGPARQFAN